MTNIELFQAFGLSLVLGALIGLEREWRQSQEDRHFFAGIRTFTLFALFGTASAFIGDLVSHWFLLVSFLGFASVVTASFVLSSRHTEVPGLTTEVSALLTVLVGVLVYYRYFEVAVALAVGVTVLLSVKFSLHQFAGRIEREDLYATLKFAIITFIVLPVLPNQYIGPFAAFNPYETWLMVVLIAGLSFLGYVAIKVLGPHRGIGLTGLLGGFVSSTAFVLIYARRSAEVKELQRMFGISIILASSIMFPRLLLEVLIINPKLLNGLLLPFLGMMAIGFASCAWLWTRLDRSEESDYSLKNPFKLTSALTLAAMYAIVSFLATSFNQIFGEQGVLFVSALSGLTSVNTITLSLANLAQEGGPVQADIAVQGITLAALVNTMLKGGVILVLAGRKMFYMIGWIFILILLGGLGLLYLV